MVDFDQQLLGKTGNSLGIEYSVCKIFIETIIILYLLNMPGIGYAFSMSTTIYYTNHFIVSL